MELRQLREEVASLRGNLKRQAEENASARNQLKMKKKLAEQVSLITRIYLLFQIKLSACLILVCVKIF